MKGFRLRRLALLTAGLAVLLAAGATTAQADDPGRALLANTKPAWTAGATSSTEVAGGQAGLSATVWLAPRAAAQLEALARAVSDPASAEYGHFLSADQVRARFAPTADEVTQVSRWLSGVGLTVTSVGADNRFVAVSGTAAAIAAAFGTQLVRYVVNGRPELAPASDLTVPAGLAGVVQAVSGITTFGHMMKRADLGPPDAFVPGTPCSAYYGEKIATSLPRFHGKKLPFNPCGYTAGTLRNAYGMDRAGTGGAGATVAITDAYDAPQLASDANTYSSLHGDAPFAPGQFTDLSVPEDASTATDCGGNGWYGEQALDVEAVHGMAPAANVLYYGAASCNDADLLVQLAQVVTDNKASIVTNSWGSPTYVVVDNVVYSTIDQGLVEAYDSVFEQGAAQGIGFYFSSGDSGDDLAAFGVKHPDYPAGDPWVTSVGGTSIAIDKNNSRLWETGWGTTTLLARRRRRVLGPARHLPLRRRRRLQPRLPAPVVPGRRRPRRARRAVPSRTSRWTAIRPPACSSARRRHSPRERSARPASTTASTASAARASPRRSWRVCRPSPQGSGRLGFANPTDLPPREGRERRVLRRDRSGRRRQRPRRLRQRHQPRRRHHLFGEDVQRGQLAENDPRLGRRHGRRRADRDVPRPGRRGHLAKAALLNERAAARRSSRRCLSRG